MARTKVKVVLKLDGLRGLTYQGDMSSMLWRKAQAVAGVARAKAPVESGRYKASFRTAFADTDRNVARVYNDAPYAVTVEYGGSESAKNRTLGNALDAAGGA